MSQILSPAPRRPRLRLLAATTVAAATTAAGLAFPMTAATAAPAAPTTVSTSAVATQAVDATRSALRASGKNLSKNPVLKRNRAGYTVRSGGKAIKRVKVRVHRGARHAARTTVAATTTRVALPRVRVVPGQTSRFSADVRAASGSQTHISVSWYASDGRFLSWSGGPTSANSPTQWRTFSGDLKAPSGAAYGETVVNVLNGKPGTLIYITNHVVRLLAAVVTVPAPSPAPTPAPPVVTAPAPTAPAPTAPAPSAPAPSAPAPSAPAPSAPAPSAPAPTIPKVDMDNSVAQPGAIVWGSASKAVPFQRKGALVVAGRVNYADPEIKAVSAAGGTVLVYLDAVIDNAYGRYHQMLLKASECGPAVPRWPGSPQANEWGYVNDFRPGSVVQGKLECVLERMVAENPHIGGFFADDLGSRSWFGGFNWDTFGAQNQQDYRDGAIGLSKTFRKVADRHNLLFMVNGTWGGGTVARAGGGYPDASQHGNALADGTYAEKHGFDSYWGNSYPCASQWANQSAVTKGMAFHFAVATNDTDRNAFARSGCYSFAATQTNYETDVAVWGSFLDVGLPTAVRTIL